MLSRRSSLAVGTLAIATGASARAQERPVTAVEHVEKELLAFRDRLRDARAARDAIKLKSMYADTFSHIRASGEVDDRDARVLALLVGEAVIEDAGVAEWRVRVHGGDTAILSGRSTLLDKAGVRTGEVRWTQVLVRDVGVWRLAASQDTPLA